MAIDPSATAGTNFADRLEYEFATLSAEPGVRLPGDRRLAARTHAEQHGVEVPDELFDLMQSYAAHGSPARRGGSA